MFPGRDLGWSSNSGSCQPRDNIDSQETEWDQSGSECRQKEEAIKELTWSQSNVKDLDRDGEETEKVGPGREKDNQV